MRILLLVLFFLLFAGAQEQRRFFELTPALYIYDAGGPGIGLHASVNRRMSSHVYLGGQVAKGRGRSFLTVGYSSFGFTPAAGRYIDAFGVRAGIMLR